MGVGYMPCACAPRIATMRTMRGMSTRQATSTTTMRTTAIGALRLYTAVIRSSCKARRQSGEGQRAESHAQKGANNRPAMPESLREIAGYSRRTSFAYSISFSALWESAERCRHGVGWKPSVMQYINHLPIEALRASNDLKDGTWVDGNAKPIKITYPKQRDGLSIRFRDRVVQRSLNDNVLYPEMTRHFINANCACQKGKGTEYARKLVRQCLHRNYLKYGHEFYVLQIDISGYYPHMRHDVVHALFSKYFDNEVVKRIDSILSKQGSIGGDGNIGYHPGSQLVQIAGISLLNGIDHRIKEKLGCRDYVRVMDDFLLMHPCKEYLEICLEEITGWLSRLGFDTNKRKTHITHATEGFTFLGFRYMPSNRHEWYMTVKSQSVKHERKKLARLAKVASKEKADECLRSYEAHLDHGNTWHLQQRLNRYQNELWRNK